MSSSTISTVMSTTMTGHRYEATGRVPVIITAVLILQHSLSSDVFYATALQVNSNRPQQVISCLSV